MGTILASSVDVIKHQIDTIIGLVGVVGCCVQWAVVVVDCGRQIVNQEADVGVATGCVGFINRKIVVQKADVSVVVGNNNTQKRQESDCCERCHFAND